jgi:hypothetical protein
LPEYLNGPALAAWCERNLGAVPVDCIFETGHISRVLGYRLSDGRQVVLKLRPASPRLAACVAVQRHLWRNGFPCPSPLAGPLDEGAVAITAEEMVSGGEIIDGNAANAAAFAAPLALLVSLCRHHRVETTLEPPPPWLGWAHGGPALWPPPDDLDADLNAYAEPAWLNDIAGRVAGVLRATRLPAVIGHSDWHAGNLRWLGTALHAVHDWDSLAHLPEAALAGGASVLFTASSRASAGVVASAAFLDAYALSRGRPWSEEETRVAWAAGLWNLCFDAKKQTLDGAGDSMRVLERDAAARLRLARL